MLAKPSNTLALFVDPNGEAIRFDIDGPIVETSGGHPLSYLIRVHLPGIPFDSELPALPGLTDENT